jgi:ABC-2 type transport system ATP-binding protein
MLHQPRLLLLDEPSTGLDPVARLNLWDTLASMAREGVAVLMTTHLLEEAEKADRVAIMSEGTKIAEGSPHQLRSELGQGVVTVVADDVVAAQQQMRELGLSPQRIHQHLRVESDSPAALVSVLVEKLGDQAQSITVGRPSLEDVFIARSGRALVHDSVTANDQLADQEPAETHQ